MNDSRALETLAVAAHSGSVVLHSLGVVYFVARDRKFNGWAALHAGLAIFSFVSVVRHARRIHQS